MNQQNQTVAAFMTMMNHNHQTTAVPPPPPALFVWLCLLCLCGGYLAEVSGLEGDVGEVVGWRQVEVDARRVRERFGVECFDDSVEW